MKNHERIHTNERPFKCKHCKKEFMKKQHLKEHIQRHKTINKILYPLICPIFSQNNHIFTNYNNK